VRAREWGLILAVMFALLVSVLLIFFALRERKKTLDRSDHQVCIAIRNLDLVVTRQLQRSKVNLPKLAYFREHPEELAQQQESIEAQLKAFRPRECP
jgi:Skp family chaperone for outer membrane proteins